jgi:hypothetical protein
VLDIIDRIISILGVTLIVVARVNEIGIDIPSTDHVLPPRASIRVGVDIRARSVAAVLFHSVEMAGGESYGPVFVFFEVRSTIPSQTFFVVE